MPNQSVERDRAIAGGFQRLIALEAVSKVYRRQLFKPPGP